MTWHTLKARLRHWAGIVWSFFLSGLFTILPITLTISIFVFSFRLVKGWLEPIAAMKPEFLDWIPHVEVLIVILFIFLIGVVLRVFLLDPLVHALEGLLFKIPLVRPIYSGFKQLIHAFSAQDHISFKRVVILEFPRAGVYSIGFLTNELPAVLAPQQGTTFYHVFIPTTPNPTSGYLAIVPEHAVTTIDITRQEAMALIISGGIILPDHYKQQPTDTVQQ